MALNVQTFKTRALSSVFFVILMLVGLWWNVWSFAILFAVIHFGCWYEYIKLARKITSVNFWLLMLIGIFYISLPIALMLDLRMNHHSTPEYIQLVIPTAIIFSIWINDTMAYLVGSFIGKTPFSKISPKKTWEGTIGGGILCIVVIAVAGYFSEWYDLGVWIAIGVAGAVAGTLGDLFESKLKRMADVKDSGRMMPGHGGFLDRFDSMLFVVPVVWLYVKLAGGL
jgi:phosphatidate cytidylyltransferase